MSMPRMKKQKNIRVLNPSWDYTDGEILVHIIKRWDEIGRHVIFEFFGDYFNLNRWMI